MNDSRTRDRGRVSRRGVLGAGVSLAAATAGAQVAGSSTAWAVPPKPRRDDTNGVELVALGTAGGPPYQPGHSGIASVLRVDGKSYLVDCGRSAFSQYGEAGLRLADLESIFITHLHADHLADYYNFFLLGGWGSHDDALEPPVRVYGPGPAGALPCTPDRSGVPTVAAENPTPGIAALTEHCHQAYAYSHNVFIRDSGIPDVRTLLTIDEIDLPDVGADPHGPTAPDMAPFVIAEDQRVSVSATLVPHGPVFPSFAFRFDTDRASVVFSGDTAYSSNLIRLARGADVLVHEAIDLDYYHRRGTDPHVLRHLEQSHTPVDAVGDLAQQAEVSTLVLTHLVPGGSDVVPRGRWQSNAQRGFDGHVVVADDLMRLPVA